jgi:hypothetical protein
VGRDSAHYIALTPTLPNFRPNFKYENCKKKNTIMHHGSEGRGIFTIGKSGAKFKILKCSKQTLSPFSQQSTLVVVAELASNTPLQPMNDFKGELRDKLNGTRDVLMIKGSQCELIESLAALCIFFWADFHARVLVRQLCALAKVVPSILPHCVSRETCPLLQAFRANTINGADTAQLL